MQRVAENGDDDGHPSNGKLGVAALDREATMEHWAQFPLKSAADVHAWHKDRCESYQLSPVSQRHLEEMNVDHTIGDLGQRASGNHDFNTNNNYHDDNIRRGALTQESQLQKPPGLERRRSRDQAAQAQTVQDVWGSFLHTSDGQYPPSSSRGTNSSRGTTLSPLPVDLGGVAHRETNASGRVSSLGFSLEFQQRFLW